MASSLTHTHSVNLPTITFGEVATHNHFAFVRRQTVFNRTAPMMNLRAPPGEDENLGILGLLNSSIAEFWMRQVMQTRAGFDERWEMRIQRDGSKLAKLPVPEGRPLVRARRLDGLAGELAASLPSRGRAVSRVAALRRVLGRRDCGVR